MDLEDGAIVDLGVTRKEFWNLTLAQVMRLHRRFQLSEKRWDVRLANLMVFYANANRGKDTLPYTLDSLFPGLATPINYNSSNSGPTHEEQLTMVRNAGFGRIVVEDSEHGSQ